MADTSKKKQSKKEVYQGEKKDPNEIYNVQLRLKGEVINEIDRLINERRITPSRHMWLEEAIFDKIDRENKKLEAKKTL